MQLSSYNHVFSGTLTVMDKEEKALYACSYTFGGGKVRG